MMIKNLSSLFIISCLLLITGCASTLSGDSYSREDARKVQSVEYGTIEYTRLVIIEGTKTPIGAGAGAVVGGIAGSSVGDGTGSAIASVIGAVVGGLAGGAAEEEITKTQGVELVVKLETSGEVIAVVQEYNEQDPLLEGDRVRITYVNGETRVTR
jgi:outer membrane lipoprotein SlyB